MSRSLRFIFIILILPTVSWGKCDKSEVRLDKSPPPDHMKHLAVMDQVDLGICYAHAMSLLSDYKRLSEMKEGVKFKRTSPLHIASKQTKSNWFDKTIEIDNENCPDLKIGTKVCSHDDIENKMHSGYERQFLSSLNKLFKNLQDFLNLQDQDLIR